MGLVTSNKDGSVGQAYSAPTGMTGVQWYRRALAVPNTLTVIPGATGITYTATASDIGFRLVARGTLSGILTDACSWSVVQSAPVLYDAYDNPSNYTANSVSGTVASASPMLEGPGSIEFTANGSSNSYSLISALGPNLNLADLGTAAVLIDTGPAELQDVSSITINITNNANTAGSAISTAGSNTSMYHAVLGRHWFAYSMAGENTSLPAPSSTRSRINVSVNTNGARSPRFKADAMVYNSKGRPKVLITADDAIRSQYNILFPLMQARGLKGTLYVPKNTVALGDGGNSAYLTTAMLNEMYAAGWDIGCNTVDDQPFTSKSDVASCVAAAEEARSWNLSKGWTRGSNHWCYSNGLTAAADTTLKQLRSGLTCNGSTVITLSSGDTTGILPGFKMFGPDVQADTTVVSVDSPTQLTLSKTVPSTVTRANFCYTSHPLWYGNIPSAMLAAGWLTGRTTMPRLCHDRFGMFPEGAITFPALSSSSATFSSFKTRIDTAVARGTTLCLYFHNFTGTGSLNYDPNDMALLADYLATLRDAGTIDVPTITEWHSSWKDASFPLA